MKWENTAFGSDFNGEDFCMQGNLVAQPKTVGLGKGESNCVKAATTPICPQGKQEFFLELGCSPVIKWEGAWSLVKTKPKINLNNYIQLASFALEICFATDGLQ